MSKKKHGGNWRENLPATKIELCEDMFTRLPLFSIVRVQLNAIKCGLHEFSTNKLLQKKKTSKPVVMNSSRMVIKDSRSLADAMVRVIDDNEIDSHRQTLISIRENPKLRSLLHERLQHEQLTCLELKKSMHWFNEWLLKALSPQKVHLFPLFVPIASNDQLLEAKATLAAYLFAYKHRYPSRFFEYLLASHPNEDYIEPQKDESTIYAKASIIANDIGDRLHISKIENLTSLVKSYNEDDADNQIAKADKLLSDITALCSMHIDLLYPLLNFLDVPINPTLQTLIDSRSLRRQHIIHDLSRELSSIVYTHYHQGESNQSIDNISPEKAIDPLRAYYYSMDKNNNRKQIFKSHGGEICDVKGAVGVSENSSSSTHPASIPEQKSFPISFATVHFLEAKVYCSQKLNFHDNLSESANMFSTDTVGTEKQEHNVDDYDQFLKSIQEEEFTNIFDGPPPLSPPPTSTGFHSSASFSSSVIPPPKSFKPSDDTSFTRIGDDFGSSFKKVLIDNLPRNVTEEMLISALEPCGKVYKVFLYNASSSSSPPDGAALPKKRNRSIITTTKELIYPNEDLDLTLQESNEVSVEDILEYVDDETFSSDKFSYDDVDEDSDNNENEEDEEDETVKNVSDIDIAESANDISAAQLDQSKKRKPKTPGVRSKVKQMAQSDRTDRYAFVLFDSEEAYFRATKDVFRLFGLVLQGQQCRIFPAESYRNFRIEMKDSVNIKDTLQAIKVALDGRFECNLIRPIAERNRPLFINMQFHNHEHAWVAFNTLQKIQQDGLVLFEPSWIRSNHYWKMAKRMKNAYLNSQSFDEPQKNAITAETESSQNDTARTLGSTSPIKAYYDTTLSSNGAKKKRFLSKYYR